MTTQGLTFVTVVFESEVGLARLQARSMALYLPPSCAEQIIVIDNTARGLAPAVTRALRSDLGVHAASLQVLRPLDICVVPRTIGWRSQQILKLCVAEQVHTDTYVVLDAKNHFIAPVGRDFFVTADGRARVAAYGFRTHPLRSSLERVLTYANVDPGPLIDRFTATVPPFVLNTQTVRSMIADVQTRAGRPFAQEFVDHELTEFFLYSAWVISQGRALEEVFDLVDARCPLIWPGSARLGGAHAAIEQARQSSSPLFGVHRKALDRLDADGRQVLAEFWVERGLFRSAGDAHDFIAAFKSTLRREARTKRVRELPIRLRLVARQALRRAG